MTKITLYTDGACSGNPGPGGWGAILVASDEAGNVLKEMELSGGEANTTNNRMELTAVIEGLKQLKRPTAVRVVSDSQYVVNTMTRGWKRKANHDLWRQLDDLARQHTITWEYVKGHAGHEYNERADQLATAAIKQVYGKNNHSQNSQQITHSAVVYIALKMSHKRGRWGILIITSDGELTLSDWLDDVTENRLALVATLDALQNLLPHTEATIYIDSDYVLNGMTNWIHGWRKRNWRKSDGQPVMHDDLWKRIDELARKHQLTWLPLDESTNSTRARLLVVNE